MKVLIILYKEFKANRIVCATILVFVLKVLPFPVLAQTHVIGSVKVGDNISLTYYPPFGEYDNPRFIPVEYSENLTGNFILNIPVQSPVFINFTVNRRGFYLLCEPNDTIEILLSDPVKNPENWFQIKGANAAAHAYYNNVYNKIPINQAYPIWDIFEEHNTKSTEGIISEIAQEIERQSKWVDSLQNEGEITPTYAAYMKTEIASTLAWEAGNQCDKHLERGKATTSAEYIKSSKIKRQLFKMVDPTDPRLSGCRSVFSYAATYYSELQKHQEIDTAKVILKDEAYIALAPPALQSYWWGRALYASKMYAPAKYNYCELFEKYKTQYNNQAVTEYLIQTGVCSPHTNETIIAESLDADLFTFIQYNLPKKRHFIDLWATWCAPCKGEFIAYDSSFYAFMQQHSVKLVYISIDKASNKTKWEKEAKALNLIGTHFLAGEKLQNSIKEVVYESEHMAIPRYLILDEAGHILSDNFLRPTDPSFKTELVKLFESGHHDE